VVQGEKLHGSVTIAESIPAATGVPVREATWRRSPQGAPEEKAAFCSAYTRARK
jgi:hypothetical protein